VCLSLLSVKINGDEMRRGPTQERGITQ